MTKEEAEQSLRDIEIKYQNTEKNHGYPVDQESLGQYANSLIDLILDMDQIGMKECSVDIDRALSMLQKLLRFINPQDNLCDYIRAFLAFFSGKYGEYLKLIGIYLKKYLDKEKTVSYDDAMNDYFYLFDAAVQNDPSFDYPSFLQKFSAVVGRYAPGSALQKYIRYLRSDTAGFVSNARMLRGILDIDPGWAAAYVELGNLYYGRAEWRKAADNYEAALSASDQCKTDELYFTLGWTYDELKEYKKEEKAYRSCLEITPSYPNASNNLGYCLYRQKRYEEAIEWYNKSIALQSEGARPCRNKFEALKKLGRMTEALALTKEYSTFFQTKVYREEIRRIEGGKMTPTDDLQTLESTVLSDYAGRMKVAEGRSGIELYPHQQDAIAAMDKAILHADEYAGLLVLPTGGGKTLTATYWLMENLLSHGNKILWLAHRHELLNQAKRSFERVCYRDISRDASSYRWRIVSGQHDKPFHIKPTDDIIIASKTSIRRGYDDFLHNWLEKNKGNVFLIIDEAHHATASEYRFLIDSIRKNTSNFKMLGLTATPFRTDEKEKGLLKKIFPDDIVYKIDMRELVNRGILSEPVFRSVQTDVNMTELFATNNADKELERITSESFFDIDSIGKDAASAIANNSKRNNAIVSEYVRHRDQYRQTLVFTLNVDMAIALNSLFQGAGVRSDFVVSDIQDQATHVKISAEHNEDAIGKFRRGELDVLVNVNILTEGTDLPMVQSVFLTRPTKSATLMTQMIGRALRGERAGGTKEAYVVSFIDDWQDKIAWVNPEKLFIDENVDFTEKNHETQKMAMRLVSIAKIEEFAKIMNGTIDKKLSAMDFLERIPIGIYRFSYLIEDDSDSNDPIERSCDVLVYDCMKKAYEDFLTWLPKADLSDIESAATHVDQTVFHQSDMLLGYHRQDIVDIIRYYKQTGETPQMILLSERNEYDVSSLAGYILENELGPTATSSYIESEWNRNGSKWAAFFGTDNQQAFRKLISDEIDRIQHPDDYKKAEDAPITEGETIQVKQLSLYEIHNRLPEIGEKLQKAVFARYTDAEGYYFSAQSGFRSKNPLDFQIDHIVPMAHGGLTIPDNLQLLTVAENMRKSDHLDMSVHNGPGQSKKDAIDDISNAKDVDESDCNNHAKLKPGNMAYKVNNRRKRKRKHSET